ncbi:orotidine 5-phosphate decarboxylase [uncultured Tateyamaria sp.]|uniref:orotidine 5-phosphate decarboxylase n=1 Tax=uncultured Tateyamaria sp. TaxID=455651 RepID=UPI002626C901|nr:orotidine 5-phosphate decarboxylase [uncultured Tateyamaria sp.]
MQTVPLQLSDVIYNAANQTFEALVSVHDGSNARRYACAIDAPIDMEFEDAARGLSTQALRRHKRGQSDSVIEATAVPTRAARKGQVHKMVRQPARPPHARAA